MTQTRLDQFFKTTIKGRKSDNTISVKQTAKLKISQSFTNKKRKSNKQSLPLSSQATKAANLSNSIITCKTEIDEVAEIETIFESEVLENSTISTNNHTVDDSIKSMSNERALPLGDTVTIQVPKAVLEAALCMKQRSTLDNDLLLMNNMRKEPRTPKKMSESLEKRNGEQCDSPSKRVKYSPKVSQATSLTCSNNRRLFYRKFDVDKIAPAIEQLNLAKQGAIPPNNFDLEEIYSRHSFTYQYGSLNTGARMKYEPLDITLDDVHVETLLTIIFTVLSKPINCGYFDDSELDLIYSIVVLPVKAQKLFIRMLKRKRIWYRIDNLSVQGIDEDLKDIFDILVEKSLCTFDISKEKLSTLLELLQVDEVRKICQKLKINLDNMKQKNIDKLLKYSKTKSFFVGSKSSKQILLSFISETLGCCVRVTEKTWNIVDRIMTLFMPNQDPEANISDTFFKLYDVCLGKVAFPVACIDNFPIFSCKAHLLSYIEAKAALSDTLAHAGKKDWKVVQRYGHLAMEKLPSLLQSEKKRLNNSTLPIHVRRYMPGYMWLKVLSQTVEAFKKNTETKQQAVGVLNLLIDQDCHMHSKKGKWYDQLAMIEMYHFKNMEESAQIIMKALERENLLSVHKVDLIERAEKIMKRKRGVTTDTKANIQRVLDSYNNRLISITKPPSNTIDAVAQFGNIRGNKSVWCIDDGAESKSYGSVEDLACYYYCSGQYISGLHCEGALPVILFFTLFWEEIFNISVPGAYTTAYQTAPVDLYTDQFYENRKEQIDMKLQIVDSLDSESLSQLMERKYITYSQYQSEMQTSLLEKSSQLREIVSCIGVEGVLGICRRLLENFRVWSSGFPDLIVWNPYTKEYKIVEVKGPGDTLSTKQRLWLDYLSHIGLDVEVCFVKDKRDSKKQAPQLK